MSVATVESADPQAMFWKKSEKEVPAHIEKELTSLFGKDDFGDPIIRARYDATKFKEGMWLIEEKWNASAFGSEEEWKRTQKVVEHGEVFDFGDFPRRGLYMAVMMVVNHDGSPMELDQRTIDKLKFQKYMRETKNISPEQVAFDCALQMEQTEKLQEQRWIEAQKALAEDMKTNAEKYLAASTRVTSLPSVQPSRLITAP